MFYKNFLKQCNKKNISPSAAAEDMGFKRSVVTRWSKGTAPRNATLVKIADYFNISVDELLSDSPIEKGVSNLTPEQEEAMNILFSLSSVGFQKAVDYLHLLKGADNQEKS
jgi:transcriptional regulator with XRE-family HTH domain